MQKQAALPSSLPEYFHTAPAGAATAEGISPYFIPGTPSEHADLHVPPMAWGTLGQEAACLKSPGHPGLSTTEPSAEGCATGGSQGKRAGNF